MKQELSLLLSLGYCTLGQSIFLNPATAQITPDGTTSTTVDVSGNDFTIEQGDRAGGNLFHSFSDFSVSNGGSAFFNNAADIVNIFSRVTGGNISNIDGLLGANGTANLFLINPAGIIFGEGARLDLGGSFYGSTADSIVFSDGEFSATDLDNPPLLTINAPIGLNFRDNPGDITVRGDGQGARTTTDLIDTENALRVNESSTLGLVGGDLSLEGATLKTPGGRIELGSVAGNEQVSFTPIDEGLSLGYEGVENFGDIQLSQTATVDASGSVAGNIRVWGNNITLIEGSQIEVSTVGTSLTDLTPGIVELNATNTITIDGENPETAIFSGVFGQVAPDAVGDGGNIAITTGTLNLTNGGFVDNSTFSQGNAGSVNITASDTITIDGENSQGGTSAVSSDVSEAIGDGGEITITTGNLNLTNGGVISSSTFSQGNAGSVNITASDTITIDGENSQGGTSAVFSRVFPSIVIDDAGNIISRTETIGEGGSITITTSNLNLTNGGLVDTSTGSQGNAGSINITASDTITIDGETSQGSPSIVFSGVDPEAIGDGGEITITTGNLNLTNGGQVSTSIFGQGNGGSINITASDNITIDGVDSQGVPSGVFSRVETVGNGGEIVITTDNLNLSTGGEVSTSTFGQGNAGLINITASDTITIDGVSSINSGVAPEAIGDSGSITITTGNLNLTNGGFVDTTTLGQGNAGSISITANDTITIDGVDSQGLSGGVFSDVNSEAIGNAGEITIKTGNLNLTNGGVVSTDTLGQGNAGSINITASDTITIDNSSVFSDVNSEAVGDGGEIAITTGNLNLTNGGVISASTFSQGNAGSVNITASDTITIDGETSQGSTSVVASSVAEAIGDGGEITITTSNLNLTNGGAITSATTGEGNAGSINITASDTITIDGESSEASRSGVFSSTSISNGNGGDINLFAEDITIDDGGTIEAGNIDSSGFFEPGTGQPGNINIRANSLSLTNEARIDTATQSETGDTANINLQLTEDLTLKDNSFISARALEDADGGNLNINARFILGFPSKGSGNDLIATAERGIGGNITINARQLFNLQEGRAIDSNGNFIANNRNDIDASSQAEGLDGTISISNPDANIRQKDTEIPSNPIESEQIVGQACQSARTSDQPSGLTVKGKGGIPPVPTEPFDSDTLLVDEQNTTSKPQAQHPEIKPIKTSMGDIYPARGIIKTEDGQIILTTYPTDHINTRTPYISANCSFLKDEEQKANGVDLPR